MNAERWHRVKTLLDEALDRAAGEERAAFLAEACAGDATGLREEVESLLAEQDEEVARFIDEGAPEDGGAFDFFPGEANLEEGARVGPYRLAGLLGRGGMGAVYRATRADGQHEREVALKVIRPGLYTSGEVARRFQAERRVLASLEHPHIARLYDSGLTSGGRPYFAMELVDGTPLDRHCDEAKCTVEQRLRLFEKVAGAVAHAHRRLVVHRDLKPSNILVTPAGEAKLLDFGIAKLLTSEADGASLTPVTRTGRPLMTPEYAAPEQVRGEAVTPATDVYALGVVLYRLLTGRRPYRFEKRTPSHIERVICETQPERPSTAVTRAPTSNETGGDAAGNGVPTSSLPRPARLRRRLRGDLDRIVMKALRKEPARRYATAAELAEDLRRHREGLPVEARDSTWRYRASKFVSRHRWGVSVAAVLALLLAGYAATVSAQAQRLAAERDRAETEAETADQVSAFLIDLFKSSYPENAQGEVVTARTLLRHGLDRVDSLRGQPAAQAEMLYVIGDVYRTLSLYDEAEHALRRSLALRRSHSAAGSPDLIESLEGLALFLRDRGQYEASDSLLRDAVAARKARAASDPEKLARSLMRLTYVQRRQGHYAQAEESIREALALQEELYEKPRMETAESLYNLAAVLRDQGRLADAESMQRRSLTMARALADGPHPGVAANLNQLATLRKERGHLQAAADLYGQALEMNRTLYGERHQETATATQNLATVRTLQREYDAAERLFQKALAINRDLHGNAHPYLATVLHNLGDLYQQQKRYVQADSLYRKALAIRRDALDGSHPRTASSLVALGQLAHLRRRPDESEAYLRQGLQMYADVLPQNHQDVAKAKSTLGTVLMEKSNYAAAQPLLLAAENAFGATIGASHPHTLKNRRALVRLHDAWGRPQQAAAWRDSLAVAQNALTSN